VALRPTRPKGHVAERRGPAPRSPSATNRGAKHILAVETVGKGTNALYAILKRVHNGYMPRYKENNQGQGRFLTVNLSEQLMEDTFEYTLNYLVNEELDLSELDSKYRNDVTGAPAYDPRVLLKIILYTYSRGIFSSRRIMELCETNIIAKALSADSVPHFTVIADFITSMREQISSIFLQILMVCQDLELIGGKMFAIDGCKLPSNASRESSGTFGELKRRKEKMQRTIKLLVNKHTVTDKEENAAGAAESQRRKKSIEKIKAKIRRLKSFLGSESPKQGSRGKEVQSNITDNESAKIKTSHGMIQGYNGIALADEKSQVIIASEAFGKGPEQGAFTPILTQAEENLQAITKKEEPLSGKTVLADTSYFSEENLRASVEKKVDAIIPDSNFRKRDARFSDRKVHGRSEDKFDPHDFKYDKKDNTCKCPNGKTLRSIGHIVLHGSSGYRYQSKISDCKECPLKSKCFYRENAQSGRRTVFISDKDKTTNYTAQMIQKIDRPGVRDIYSRRMGIIEPVFANITFHKKLNRFTLRGHEKVNIQWKLYCMVHNIGKIMKAMAIEA
jgi:transposase